MTQPLPPDPIPRIVIPQPAPASAARPTALQVRREDPPECLRCGAATLLSAHLPNTMTSSTGFVVHGTVQIALCASCDGDDPAAAALISFFRHHQEVTDDSAEEFAGLLQEWVLHLARPKIDQAQLDREYEEWLRDEL